MCAQTRDETATNKAAWALQILAALMFTASGGMKLAKSPADLRANPAMAWTTQFTDVQVKAIGAAEVAGAIGLIMPTLTGIVPTLTPAAGVALSALMGGAAVRHFKRGEPPFPPLVPGLLALAAGVLRFRVSRRAATRPA